MFNLINDEWIPVAYADGSLGTVGFRKLFREATSIRSIETGWSASDAAVFDIALAIAYRALGSADSPLSAARGHLQDGALYAGVEDYLDANLRHFDLDRFGQVQSISTDLGVGLDRIALELSSGGSDIHEVRPGTFRSIEDVAEQSLAQFALDLVTAYRADLTKPGSALPGSRLSMLDDQSKKGISKEEMKERWDETVDKGKRDMGGVGLSLYPRLTLSAPSFAETLVLNMPPQSAQQHAEDRAAWEFDGYDTTIDHRCEQGYLGYADWLTYQQRAIKLHWDDGRPVSVTVGASNFRVTSGASGSHKEGDFSDKTEAFFASSPVSVAIVVTPGEKESPINTRRPHRIPSNMAWTGIDAFSADSSADVLPGENVRWANRLTSSKTIGRDRPIAVTYQSTSFGPSSTTYWVSYTDTYFLRGWMAADDARHIRSEISAGVALAVALRKIIWRLEEGIRQLAYGDPKLKKDANSSLYGVVERATTRFSEIIHSEVGSADSTTTTTEVRERLRRDLGAAAIAEIDRVSEVFPPEIIATSSIPTMMEFKKEEVRITVENGTSTSAEVKKSLAKKAAGVETEQTPAHEIARFVYGRIALAKRDPGLRVGFASINGRDPMDNPAAVMSAFCDWSDDIEDRDAADRAVQSSLGIWGASSGGSATSDGPGDLFSVARLAASQTPAIERTVRSILATSDYKQVVYHMNSLVKLLVSLQPKGRFRVNFGDLALDLYNLQINPKRTRYQWARQFSTGKAA